MLRGTGWPHPSPLTSSCVLALSFANILVVPAAPTGATERASGQPLPRMSSFSVSQSFGQFITSSKRVPIPGKYEVVHPLLRFHVSLCGPSDRTSDDQLELARRVLWVGDRVCTQASERESGRGTESASGCVTDQNWPRTHSHGVKLLRTTSWHMEWPFGVNASDSTTLKTEATLLMCGREKLATTRVATATIGKHHIFGGRQSHDCTTR
jgi:hypothetical protein